MAHRAPLPVTLVTGFLGAGKTTLVNRVLHERHGERIAVVVNEFGSVGIDGRLVVASEDEVVELANGCVCCSVRGDLIASLGRLLDAAERRLARRPLERILIETSGLASPGPILQTLRVEPRLATATRASGVVTLVHAGQALEQLARHPEAPEQVAYATTLVLGHVDAAADDQLAQVEAELARRNPTARRVRALRGDVPLELVLEDAETLPGAEHEPAADGGSAAHTAGASALVLRSRRPLDLHRLKMWLAFVAGRRRGELWRMKGLVACSGHRQAVLVQAVYQVLELGPCEERTAPEESVLVVIGRDLDPAELERGWAACQG